MGGERHREARSAKGRRVEGDRRVVHLDFNDYELMKDMFGDSGPPSRRDSFDTYKQANRRDVMPRRLHSRKDRRS